MSARLAKEIADHIEEATNASRNGARDTSFFELKVAGVKATLYAAEQQRIANLIEAGRDRNANVMAALNGGRIISEAGEEYSLEDLMSRAIEVQVLVREGLGLA